MPELSKPPGITRNEPLPPRRLGKWLPALVLLATVAFDRTGLLNFTLVPIILVMALVVFSFSLPSRHLLGWAAIYVLVIALTLWLRRGLWEGSSGNAEAMVATRSLAAVAAGILACFVAKRREQEQLLLQEIYRIFDHLNMAVITSDADGWLSHLNPQALELLGGSDALGSPYFSQFSTVSRKGNSIQNYVDLVTGKLKGPIMIDLAVGDSGSRTVQAVLTRVDFGGKRSILTLVHPEPQVPTGRAADANEVGRTNRMTGA